jgi:aminoglycoside 3-N-acetyltransferase
VGPTVSGDDIIRGLEGVGMRGSRLIVHASLSSFGHVAGGADAVADALITIADTVLVPTFTYAPAARVPEDDRPPHNGADYSEDPLGSDDPVPFTPDLAVAKPIGMVAETLRCRPAAVRSNHPLSSFAAIGADAARYAANHDWNRPMQPIQRLCEDDGDVLMLGTPLTSCTAIHWGEACVGRRPFIRWAKVADGAIHRVRVGGCSDGFEKLAPYIRDVRQTRIGQARVRMFRCAAVVEATVQRLREDPYALSCDRRCLRCLDAAAGGPAE